MPKIIHYREKCIGCNSCVEYAPDRWVISKKDGKSDCLGSTKKKETHVAKIEWDEVERNKQAAKNCPVRIIQVIE